MSPDPTLSLLNDSLPRLQERFEHLPALPAADPATLQSMSAVLGEVAERLADNYPYFHPLYAGQMLKPPHPVARAAYAMAMWLNPNNHALDGGRASSQMEVEAVREIAAIFSWTTYLGHLTSGGTFANLEALWVAGQLHPGKRILGSAQAHYTHSRITQVLGIAYTAVAADARGRMDLDALEAELQRGDVGTVVLTLGTTASGAVDPLPQILALRDRYSFRIHIDAAYGGYFALVGNLQADTAQAFAAASEADSIVIDPHKHGLQPYGCGCVLFRDPGVGRFYKHSSPYTYFTSSQLHLGEISLECSRAGASAVALWATQRLFPLTRGGVFAAGLERCRDAALQLHARIRSSPIFLAGPPPELDIVVFAVRGATLEESSRRARQIFERAAANDLHVAIVEFPVTCFTPGAWPDRSSQSTVTCLRSVLMKPEHFDWLDIIWERLNRACESSW